MAKIKTKAMRIVYVFHLDIMAKRRTTSSWNEGHPRLQPSINFLNMEHILNFILGVFVYMQQKRWNPLNGEFWYGRGVWKWHIL